MQPALILASSSPFRRALLEKLGLTFLSESPDIDESQHADESAEQLVARLALEKARTVAGNHPNALVIGSDQVACIDGTVLGKPHTEPRAIEQLRAASGRQVRFSTGLCLYNSADNSYQLDVVPFDVHFRTLSDKQIRAYIQREQPLNCAGSFKSEGLGIALFEKLEGDDPNTLIGLPLIRLIAMLEKAGLDVLLPD
ncbi:Maf family protein [Marinobacterium litorale]|jgi:MAF protein|uniref:Maf family protein n=1 Tax=Marinobacterium litorale TaxID=404770 RepID=UPI0004221616|nr:nucleoside triphosphate pyrophosphatase [Marinobacterium litorale]